MIATIKRPGIEMRGNIPEAFLEVTRKFFGADDVEIVDETDDELVSITDTAWYTKRKADHNPGRNLKNYRGIHGFTQAILAGKLGVLTHHISEMESGKRAISKAMALKLSEVFDVSPERFI
jgi:DNA-binding XRE family transcriptional regulator